MATCPVTTDPERAAECLCGGGLVALPTETVYGLGGDALSPTALARIFDAKNRPLFDPLILHVPDLSAVAAIVDGDLPPMVTRLAERFWPGPLTLLLPKRSSVPDLATAGLPTVAVRIPDHPLTQAVLRRVGRPIAAPSANPFGRLSPTTAAHVASGLGDRIDMILDGGPCRVGVESTIVGVEGDRLVLHRPGGIPVEALETIAGPVQLRPTQSAATGPQAAPGLYPQHYAPRTPLTLVDPKELAAVIQRELTTSSPGDRLGVLVPLGRLEAGPSPSKIVEELAPSGDLVEAAAAFFPALHRLDATGVRAIIAGTFPEQGLGRALNDRLRRASFRNET